MPITGGWNDAYPQWLPTSDVLEFQIAGDNKLIVRPSGTEPTNAGWYASLLEGLCHTNMPQDILEAEIRNFMKYDGEVAFNMGTGPYEGGIDWTEKWRCEGDPEGYARLSEAMRSGTPLTDVVPEPAPLQKPAWRMQLQKSNLRGTP